MDRRRLLEITTAGLIATIALFWLQAFLGLNNVWLLLGLFSLQQAFFAVNQRTRTAILRNSGSNYREDARTPAQGAATPCYAAVHPAMAGVSGACLRDFTAGEQSAQQQDAAMAARLWAVSRELVARNA